MKIFMVSLSVLMLAAGTVPAADLSFVAAADLTDEGDIIKRAVYDHFGPDRKKVEVIMDSLPDDEGNLAPALFLTERFGKDIHFIVQLRLAGMPWNDIFNHVDVPVGEVLVDLPENPGPPYGKAYGFHKKDKPGKVLHMSDEEIGDWLNLKIGSAYFGVDPGRLAAERAKGESFRKIFAERYREKKGKSKGSAAAKGKGQEKEKGNKDKGKSKGRKH